MIPGWKVKRELLRFRQQIAWYWELTQARRRTRQHDRDRPRLVHRHDGAQPQATRIAALLIFQPGPMPASILESCDLLTGLGYAVLVVSNGPLQPEAQADLLPHVWRLLERPNLGYDFGGYREAVMHLWDEGLAPDELLVLNDSVWIIASVFPAFLARLAALDAEVTGSVMRSKKGKRWIESYFFRFSKAALAQPAFRSFWRNYRLINSKFGVIRQGEREFSVALQKGGLSVASLGENSEFLAQMGSVPDDEIRLALAYAAPVSGGLADDRTRLLSTVTEPHWRTRALAHLQATLSGRTVWNAHFPAAALRVMTYPFVKRSREPVNADWRGALVRAVADGIVPSPSPIVVSEMEAVQGQVTSAKPHWMPI